jgi:hypothetical protein
MKQNIKKTLKPQNPKTPNDKDIENYMCQNLKTIIGTQVRKPPKLTEKKIQRIYDAVFWTRLIV